MPSSPLLFGTALCQLDMAPNRHRTTSLTSPAPLVSFPSLLPCLQCTESPCSCCHVPHTRGDARPSPRYHHVPHTPRLPLRLATAQTQLAKAEMRALASHARRRQPTAHAPHGPYLAKATPPLPSPVKALPRLGVTPLADLVVTLHDATTRCQLQHRDISTPPSCL